MKPKISAIKLSSSKLSPFTDRVDIITTDFEGQELVKSKLTTVPKNRWFFSRPIDGLDDDYYNGYNY